MPAGLYVHVPFCRRRCDYCDFYSVVASESAQRRFVTALLREADLRRPAWEGQCFDSVFLGGGTPSLLGSALLSRLLIGLRERLSIESGAEWTLEANPESIDRELLEVALVCGINRLSLGIQSFDDEVLTSLGRIHDAAAARAAIAAARAAGVPKLGVDLIYGLPSDLSGSGWNRTLREAIASAPEHVSCYLLTLEPGVPMARDVASGRIRLPSDGSGRAAYDRARRLLGEGGYEHYEISNWSRPGKRCRHNVNVWSGGSYLGLGPGAHSHQNGVRRANRPDLDAYLGSLETGRWPPCREETINRRARLEERIFLGLRMREGLSWPQLAREFGSEVIGRLRERAADWAARGLMSVSETRLQIAEEGLFVSDALVSELIDALEGE